MNMVCPLKGEEKGKLLPRCYFCGEVPEEGIHGGWKIKKAFVCKSCEFRILTMEVGSPDYKQMLEKIKSILK